MEGALGHRQLRVRLARAAEDASRVSRSAKGLVLLEGSAQPGLGALAVGSDGSADVSIDGVRFAIARSLAVAAGESTQAAFYLAAGPERDGAEATAAVMERRGWRALLPGTREALRQLEQSTGSDPGDRLINRNLLVTYFHPVGRPLHHAHYYLVRPRAPRHGLRIPHPRWA